MLSEGQGIVMHLIPVSYFTEGKTESKIIKKIAAFSQLNLKKSFSSIIIKN